jgi:aminoglycoside phosphotransferase (APT) family kinase protein
MHQEAISTQWLNHALAKHRADAAITAYQIEDVGIGKGFGGTVLRASLTYDGETHDPKTRDPKTRDPKTKAPRSVIIKLPVRDADTLEALGVQGMLEREARFYAELAPTADLDTPDIYYVEYNETGFAIVMEDLGDIKRPDRLLLSDDEMKKALSAAAKLHATFWNHSVTQLDWLAPVTNGDEASRADNGVRLQEAIRLVEASDQDCSYTLNCLYRLKRLLPKAPNTVPLPNPVTLAHGDFHGDNLHISGDQVTIFDWQLVAQGTPAMDVANLIFSSSDADRYLDIVNPLLRHYHQALLHQGIRGYSFSKFKRGYGDATFFTFLKFVIILGTIDFDVQGGAEMRADIIDKLDKIAINTNVLRYCRLLPLIFVILKIINFFRRPGR